MERNAAGRLVASDELKQEIDRWGGLGTLYGLLRADHGLVNIGVTAYALRSGLRRLPWCSKLCWNVARTASAYYLAKRRLTGIRRWAARCCPPIWVWALRLTRRGCRKRKPRLPQNWPPAASISHWYPVWTSPATALGPLRGMLRRGPLMPPHVRGHRYRYAG